MLIPGSYQRPFQAIPNPRRKPIHLIAEISDILAEDTDVDRVHFFYVNAQVLEFKTEQDKMYYLACPINDCKRKVTPEINDTRQEHYWCEYCKRHFRTCNPTYMFQAKMADFTESIVVSFARDNGTTILGGLTPEQFREFKETQADEGQMVDTSAVVQDYLDS